MIRIEQVQDRVKAIEAAAKAGSAGEAAALERQLYVDTLETIESLGWLGIGLAPELCRAALGSRRIEFARDGK